MALKFVGLILLCCVIAAQGNVNVYTDSVIAPFSDWSYGTTHSAQSAAQHHSGSYSYSLVPGSYDAIYFYIGNGLISASKYSQITFWVYRTAGSDDAFNFNLVTYNGTSNKVGPNSPVTSYITGAWNANTWVQATVSLSSFPAQNYDGFWLQYTAAAPTTTYTLYVDDVVLVNASSSPTTAAAAVAAATSVKASTTTSSTSVKAATTTTTAAATSIKAATSTTTSAATSAKASTSSTTGAQSPTTGTAKPATTSGSTSSSSGGGSPVIVSVNSNVPKYFTTTTSGSGTYYGVYTNGGECGLDPSPPDAATLVGVAETVAISTNDYLLAATCGMCLQVTGNGTGSGANPITGTRVVYVNNECPSCNPDSLDFGLSGDGLWGISWKAVPCPAAGSVQYVFKSGSSAGWLGIQVRNAIVPTYSVEVQAGGNWVNLPLQSYNYFVNSVSPALTLPYKVRLTSVFGEQVIDTLSQILSVQTTVVNGAVQYTLS